MSFGNKVLGFGGFANREAGYEIEQSVLFSGSQYFHRTPGSAGNRKTWTWSGWVKRGNLASSSWFSLFGAHNDVGASGGWTVLQLSNDYLLFNEWSTNFRISYKFFRDVSAWYHIVLAVDTTQGTADDRIKMYVNGTMLPHSQFGTKNNPSQNADLGVNNTIQHRVGAVNYSSNYGYFKGYMAEVHFIDGTALDASSFGETDLTTGQWVPKKAAGLTYGTNGFYLKFVEGAEGTDSSGEGNNYTAVDGSSSDIDEKVMLDTPTNNFAVIDPHFPNATTTPILAEGNLVQYGRGGSYATTKATMSIKTGKWYWEYYIGYEGGGGIQLPGIVQGPIASTLSNYPGFSNSDLAGFSYGAGYVFGATPAGATAGENVSGNTVADTATGDIVSFASDIPNGTLKIYKNNSLEYTVTGIGTTYNWMPAFCSYATAEWGIANFGQNGKFLGAGSHAGGNTDENGYGDFKYAVPSGYLALCSKNLAIPAVKKPTDYFNTVLYTGNNTDNTDISGVGFQPEFTWVARRDTYHWNRLHDSARGAGYALRSDNDDAQATETSNFKAFLEDGFRLGLAGNDYNASGGTYAAWNWLAGTAPTATNSASAGAAPTAGSVKIDGVNFTGNLAGSIAATKLSANTTSGFSIVTYPGGSGTVAHGLGVAPDIVIQKKYDSSGDWMTYVDVVDGSADIMRLNTGATITAADPATLSTSTVFSTLVGGNNVVAYCFASIEGYSKMGYFVGNGNANGPLVYTGFRPAMVIIRNVDADQAWVIIDNKRDEYNVAIRRLYPSETDGENTNTNVLDFLSNGFKMLTSDGGLNSNTADHMYLCFAKLPFKYSNAS